MYAIAMVVGAVTVAGVAIVLTKHDTSNLSTVTRSLVVSAALIVGIAIAGAYIVLARLLHTIGKLQDSLSRLEAKHTENAKALDELSVPPDLATDIGSDTLPIRTDTPTAAQWHELLTEVQALRKRVDQSSNGSRPRDESTTDIDLEESLERVDDLLAAGEFHKAGELSATLRSRHPSDGRVTALPGRIESVRRRRESSDISEATQEVTDLISMSAWSQARQRAQFLQEQHPDSPEARHLMLRIERDYRQAQDEQQRRMYAEVQRFVTRRRWSEALAAAHTFIERFSGSDDAEALRMQIPTLETNAEIEARQQMEAQIMALAKHGRYIEATALAKRVIESYPDSPQADVLRRQIDRLEELATNPDAPPARVRIE